MIIKFDALQEKPWYLQLAIFSAGALVVYAGFWYLITSGTRVETSQLEEQVATLKQSNMRAQIASQRLTEFKAAYARVQADYDDLRALLPEQRELTVVLQGIQDRARGLMSLRRFTPKDDVQQNFYTGKPIEVEVTGTYNNLGTFYAQMAANQRIVSITDFKVMRVSDQNSKKTIDAQFLLTAYYLSPEKLESAAKLAVKPAVGAVAAAPPPQ